MDETTHLLLHRVAVLRSQLKNEKMYPRLETLESLMQDLEQAVERAYAAENGLSAVKETLLRQNQELVTRNEHLLRQKETLERSNQDLERQVKTLERHNSKLMRQIGQVGRHNAALEEQRIVLEQDTRRYHDLFEYSVDPALITDPMGVIKDANQSAVAMFNTPQRELKDENLLRFVASRNQQLFMTLLTHLQRMQDIELTIQPRGRPTVDISVTVSAQYNEEGKPTLLHWNLRDVTERHRAMTALNASERRFRTIFNEASIGILLLDPAGKIIRANRAIQEMLGYGEEELLGKLLDGLVCPDDAPLDQVGAMLQEARQGQFMLENRLRRRDGAYIWTSISLSGLRSEHGNLVYLIGMVKNITQEKQSAAELAEMRRRLLESGEVERLRLAQELHDGPTQDIYSMVFCASSIKEKTGDPGVQGELESLQGTLKTVANHLRDIVGELRPPTIGNLGLERAIRSHVEKIQEQNPALEIKMHLTRDGQTLPAHTRLAFFRIYQQCMSNILRHAQASQAVVAFHANEDAISLDIWDNGKGFQLPGKWVDFLREGHYGLASIAERVQALGGDFKVETKPGSGTLVHVTAPMEKAKESAAD